MSKGAYVAFLDSDDLWDSNKLSKQVALFESSNNPKLGLIYTNYKLFRSDPMKSVLRAKAVYEYITVNDDYHKLLIYCYIGTLTVMVKRAVMSSIGLFDESLHGTEDWDLWLRIAETYDIVGIHEPLAFYREHASGISKNKQSHFQNELKVLDKHVLNRSGISNEFRRLSLWSLQSRKIHYYFHEKAYSKAFMSYYKMILVMPFSVYNVLLPLVKLRELILTKLISRE